LPTIEGGSISGMLTLAHEIFHAFQEHNNKIEYVSGFGGRTFIGNRKEIERNAVKFANYIRSVYGYSLLRHKYSPWYFFKDKNEEYFNEKLEKILISNY